VGHILNGGKMSGRSTGEELSKKWKVPVERLLELIADQEAERRGKKFPR